MTLKALLKQHRQEIEKLRKGCSHEELRVYYDRSVIGLGCNVPSVHIYCSCCGSKKIIFRESAEMNTSIVLTLEKQEGFKDQRLNLSCHESELRD